MLRPSLAGLALALAAVLPAQNCLTTIMVGTTTTTSGCAAVFDITVANPILLTQVQCNFAAALGTNVGLNVWICPTTYVGNTTNQALWTQIASFPTGSVTSAGPGQPTIFTLSTPYLLNPGSYGVSLDCDGTSHRYSSTAATSYSDANLTINLGAIQGTPWTGTLLSPRQWNGTLCYQLGSGLFPNFTATPTSGTEPLTVQFTDATYSSDPGGVLAWSWDLDGDGNPDATAQNPSYTYLTEGSYNVSLTALDATHGQRSITKTGYIKVGFVDAGFTTQVLAGTTVAFTDTSTGGPTSWAWDFDGDNVIDSTSQNPIHTYPAAGQYSCKLTVTDAISSDSVTIPLGIGILPLPAFGSTYSSATSTRGLWFQTPVRFSIVSLKVPDESNHGLQNVAVYRLAAAPPNYSASASGGLEFFQAGTPSSQTIPCAISYDANEFVGVIGACGNSTTMRTSYATPTGSFASSLFGNPVTIWRLLTQTNIVTTGGTGAYSGEPTAAIGRVVLGVSAAVGLRYGNASASGTGAAAPKLTTSALPILGQTAQLTVDQQDLNTFGFVTLGFGRASVPTPFGELLVSPILWSDVLNGGALMGAGQFTYNFPVPLDPALNGAGPVNWQNINFVTGSGTFSMSNGQEWWLAAN
ncbi:MAG: PKD domain-containing protein [Planctomycetes bacterium]|nr:PKD domain-containing protein [Planctomycetota bacterium]